MPRLYLALLKLSNYAGDTRGDEPPAKLDGDLFELKPRMQPLRTNSPNRGGLLAAVRRSGVFLAQFRLS